MYGNARSQAIKDHSGCRRETEDVDGSVREPGRSQK